jgi:uncharacterized protein involved in type VI secretion and phage assembly
MTRFFGKYRGKVANNVDSMQLGRLQVTVPAVLGEGQLSWAMPCTPVGANVWVEFEEGDTDYPIWSGCFWGSGECPASPAVAEMKVLKTDTAIITISDMPGAGGIKIETTSGMKIEISATGIEINNGQGASIKMNGPKISLNDQALEVT